MRSSRTTSRQAVAAWVREYAGECHLCLGAGPPKMSVVSWPTVGLTFGLGLAVYWGLVGGPQRWVIAVVIALSGSIVLGIRWTGSLGAVSAILAVVSLVGFSLAAFGPNARLGFLVSTAANLGLLIALGAPWLVCFVAIPNLYLGLRRWPVEVSSSSGIEPALSTGTGMLLALGLNGALLSALTAAGTSSDWDAPQMPDAGRSQAALERLEAPSDGSPALVIGAMSISVLVIARRVILRSRPYVRAGQRLGED